jgi:hypothetical protein
MVKFTTELSISEARVLAAAAEIGFGELVDVEVEVFPKSLTRDITASQIKFIELLRDGLTHIDKIIVHNHEPVSLEVNGRSNNIKYIRKFKV